MPALVFLLKFLPLTDAPRSVYQPAHKAERSFRLKGKGFPGVNSYEKGDQLIYLERKVVSWQNLSAEERSPAEKMNMFIPNYKPCNLKNLDSSFFDKVREMFSWIIQIKQIGKGANGLRSISTFLLLAY